MHEAETHVSLPPDDMRWRMQQAVYKDSIESRHHQGYACSGSAFLLRKELMALGYDQRMISDEFVRAKMYQDGEEF